MVFFILLFILFLYLAKKVIEVTLKATQSVPDLKVPEIKIPEIKIDNPINQVTGIGSHVVNQINDYIEQRKVNNYTQDNISAGTAVLYDHKYED